MIWIFHTLSKFGRCVYKGFLGAFSGFLLENMVVFFVVSDDDLRSWVIDAENFGSTVDWNSFFEYDPQKLKPFLTEGMVTSYETQL